MKLIDLAKQLNLSPATVSRVLAKDPTFNVKEETKKLIIDTAISSGYKFKTRTKKNKEISIITSYSKEAELEDTYYLNLRAKLEQELANIGFSTINTEFSFSMELNEYNILLGAFSYEQLESLIKHTDSKIILCDSYTRRSIDCVAIDYKNSVFSVLELIVSKGYSKIGFIGGKDADSIDFRLDYFTKFTTKNNLYNQDFVYIDSFNSKTGYEGIKKIFSNELTPKVIFAGNDNIALGCYKALKELNYTIPNDIAIIGFNNTEFSGFMSPPLTSVNININSIVTETLHLLKERMKGERKYAKKILLETEIIKRESL